MRKRNLMSIGLLIALALVMQSFLTSCGGVTGESVKEQLFDAYNEAAELHNNTAVGTEVGQVSREAKDQFKAALETVKAVYDDPDSTDEDYQQALEDLEAARTAFEASIVSDDNTEPEPEPEDEVNKDLLVSAVSDANTLNSATSVGEGAGQVPQAAKDDYEAAINAAQAVVDDADATQDQVDTAVANLAAATTAFEAAIIVEDTPVENPDPLELLVSSGSPSEGTTEDQDTQVIIKDGGSITWSGVDMSGFTSVTVTYSNGEPAGGVLKLSFDGNQLGEDMITEQVGGWEGTASTLSTTFPAQSGTGTIVLAGTGDNWIASVSKINLE